MTLTYIDVLEGVLPTGRQQPYLPGKDRRTLSARATQLGVQYNMHRWDSDNGIQAGPILGGTSNSANGTDKVKTDFVVASLNSVLGNRWLNEARVQVGRDSEQQIPNSAGPSTTVTGGVSFGMPDFLPRVKYPDERRYQFIDNISYYAGAHSLKAGSNQLRPGESHQPVPGRRRLQFLRPAGARIRLSSGGTGCVPLSDGARTGKHYTSYSQAFDLRGLASRRLFFTTTDYNFFVQDTWKPHDALTLNLGLRYEPGAATAGQGIDQRRHVHRQPGYPRP